MRVIIINDDDGHAHAIEATAANLKKLVAHLDDIGRTDLFSKEKPAADAEASEWEGFLDEAYVTDRSGGGQIYFVDVKEEWDFPYGPFC
jgi:hypothetical protein